MWWGVGAALYLSVGLVDGVVTAIWHRRLSHALLLDEHRGGVNDRETDEFEGDEVEA